MLDLTLSQEDISFIRDESKLGLKKVLKAVKWRNKIIHQTGRFPQEIMPQEAETTIKAVLNLVSFLALKRDHLDAEPAFSAIGDRIFANYGQREIPRPFFRLLGEHRVVVEFVSFVHRPAADESVHEAVIQEVISGLSQRDKYLKPEKHLTVAFRSLFGDVHALWFRGKLYWIPSEAAKK